MKKLGAKQLTFLKAAQTGHAFAVKADMTRSKRIFKFVADFEAGDFNHQADALMLAGLIIVGKHTDGVWGPRHVWITAKGQEALKEQ